MPLSKSVKLNSKNGIFTDKNIEVNEAFREGILKYYGAAVEKIDSGNVPKTVTQINAWAANNIHKKLKEIVTDGSYFTHIVRLDCADLQN